MAHTMRCLVAGAVLLLCVSSSSAVFEVQKMGLRVLLPTQSRATFDMALANFGEPKYGASMMGQLVYPSSDPAYNKIAFQCTPVPCEYACSPLNESKPPFVIQHVPGRNNIMLIDRGPRQDAIMQPCTFLEKVYYAQAAGADAVIYVNDREGDLLTPDTPSDVSLAKLLANLTIPAGFISLPDGTKLKALMKAGPVTVALNWTNILPRAPKVAWELWTNSNDECGQQCDQQQAFVKTIKPIAQALQKGGYATFSPHYLLWTCPSDFGATDACASQCIRNGTYCCPDPDDNIHKGYSGADVLWMNVRSLCFYRVANMSAVPWTWWEYVDKVGGRCPMSTGRFTPSCAEEVFKELQGDQLLQGKGRQAWAECIGHEDPKAGPIKMLDDEIDSQHGADGRGSVAILPTIRINGQQYRGSLEAEAVTRALCSAFPLGSEPAVCNNEAISENECKPGGVGYIACHNGTNAAAGTTECVNTFAGYECKCGQGFVKLTRPLTNEEYCADINECLVTNEPRRLPDCSCPRCTCINEKGGFRCSGNIEDQCTEAHNFGGCWNEKLGGKQYHACADNLDAYRLAAVQGTLDVTIPTFKCECPKCFRPAPGGKCVPNCDLKACDAATGVCMAPGAAGRGGGGGAASSGGVGALAVVLIVFFSMAATAGAMFALYQYHLRHKMRENVRDMFLEYMPLADTDAPGSVRVNGVTIQAAA